jgi:hypothetical protein
MSPSLTFRYTPDFSKPVLGKDWGYIEHLTDSAGTVQKHDRFSGTLAGGTPTQEVKALGVSVNNVFQAKVVKNDKEKKLDLFSWSLSSNYNFVAKEYPLSNLRSSIRTKFSKGLSLDISMAHDFYAWDDSLGQRSKNINRGIGGLPAPRLLNVNLSTSFRFSGKRIAGVAGPDSTDLSVDSTLEDLESSYMFSNRLSDVGRPIEGGQLWSTSLSFRYSLNNANPTNPVKTFWMNSNTTIQLTQAWRIKYTARFDLIKRSLVSHGFSIYRDLHCWEMSINWTPSGYGQGFYLKINVKSPNLRDLKLEQRGGVFKSRPNF